MKITPINNYNQRVFVTWSLSVYGDFIVSPNNGEAKIEVEARGDNPRKPNIPIVIKSRRALSDRELKGLIRLSASDPSVSTLGGSDGGGDGLPVLSNGNKVIFLDAVPGKDPLKPTEVRFEVKGWFSLFFCCFLPTKNLQLSEILLIVTTFAKTFSNER